MEYTSQNDRERHRELEGNIRQAIRRLNDDYRQTHKPSAELIDQIAKDYAERCIIEKQAWMAYELMHGGPKRSERPHNAFFRELKLEDKDLLELVMLRVIDELSETVAEVDLTKLGGVTVDELRDDFERRMSSFAAK